MRLIFICLFLPQSRQLGCLLCQEPLAHGHLVLHAIDKILSVGNVLCIGMRGGEFPALHALGTAVRVIGTCVLAFGEHRGVDLASASERAEDRAAGAEIVAGTREARDGVLARR